MYSSMNSPAESETPKAHGMGETEWGYDIMRGVFIGGSGCSTIKPVCMRVTCRNAT